MGSSTLRPETSIYTGKQEALDARTTYWMVTEAVKHSDGLAYGKLHDEKIGLSCAIGTLWDANPKVVLASNLIDEVAAVNDMFNNSETPKQRRLRVLRWLRWKLSTFTGNTASFEV